MNELIYIHSFANCAITYTPITYLNGKKKRNKTHLQHIALQMLEQCTSSQITAISLDLFAQAPPPHPWDSHKSPGLTPAAAPEHSDR